MASGGAEKAIGRLTLDISDVEKKIDKVNEWLGKIGANVNLEDKLSKKISAALEKLVSEAKHAGEEAQKAMQSAVDSDALKDATERWKEYYQLMTKSQNAQNAGKNNLARFYSEEAEALVKNVKAMQQQAEAIKAVSDAKRAYNAAIQAGVDKQHADAVRDGAAAARESAAAHKEVQKILNEINNIKVKAQRVIDKKEVEEDKEALEALVALYKLKAELDTKATKAVMAGNTANANMWMDEERKIDKLIAAMRELHPELEKWALLDDRVTQAELKRQEAINNARQKSESLDYKAQEEAIGKYADALEALYNAQAKLNQDLASDKVIKGTNEYEDRINQIARLREAAESAGAELSDSSRREAEGMDRVTAAVQKATDSYGTLRDAQAVNTTDAQIESIDKYATALEKLYNEQAKLNQDLASGKVIKGTNEYEDRINILARLTDEAKKAGSALSDEAKREAEGMDKVTVAVQNATDSFGKLRDVQANKDADAMAEFSASKLKEAEDAYKALTTAIKNYRIEKQAGNDVRANQWAKEVSDQMQIVSGLEQELSTLNIDADTRARIVSLIEQAKTAQNGMNNGMEESVQQSTELSNQIAGLLTRMFSIIAVIRTIKELIGNTVEYVTEYSNKMNEIQIITQKTDSEVAQLADRYRQIASDMSVSSLDMADAAIYFTRQGLGAAEIENRLKNVTRYAKTANVEFTQASEIITAVVNSMGLVEQEAEDGRNAAQRVADVFLNVGDSAATSGQEIGEAMQKAAASAGAFGMSFEWLAAYIATVSETTRQEARTIGTAFNTIIARLHQIKQQGYNSEDETKINDIQKALAKIGITLMDQNNEWRDMDTIFQEIGEQWGTLDGKTKSYIATTMAGVKQQNVFLALMNDLGKGVENNSRAMELYEKAIKSAGTSQEKYATYLDSVTAAQERLNIAKENFYSNLDDDVIKGWYNSLAGFVNMINSGTEAFNGLNIIIPVVIAAIAGLIAIVVKFDAIATSLMAHPVMATIGLVSVGVMGLITVISGLGDAIGSAKQRFDEANQALAESRERLDQLSAAKTNTESIFDGVAEGARLTAEDLDKYSNKLEQIASVSPTAKMIVDQLRDGLIDQAEAARQLNEEIDRLIGNENKYSQVQLLKKYANWQPNSTDNDSMMYFLATTYRDFAADFTQTNEMEGSDRFAYNLKNNWMSSETVSKMPQAVRDRISELRKSLSGAIYADGSTMSDTDKWGIIGQIIWQEFVGTDSYSVSDALAEQANSIIDEAMGAVGTGLDATHTAALRGKLTKMLFGDDGIIDESEYSQMIPKMRDFVTNVLANGLELSDVEMAETIGDALFGTGSSGIFEEYGEEFSKSFLAGYEEAIKAGFSNEDIARMFKETGGSIEALDMIGDVIAENLQQSIAKAMGKSDWLSLLDFTENWDMLDLEGLKLVMDYVNNGIEIEQIDELVSEAENVDDFKAKLKELANTLGVELVESEEDGGKAIKNFADIAKDAKNDINALDKVLKEVEGGKTIKSTDILDIAKTHPEILQFLQDEKQLVEAINRIKEEVKETAVQDMYENLLDNEKFMKSSKFADYTDDEGNPFATLRELMEYNPDAGVDTWLNQIIEDMLALTDNADEATTSVADLLKTIKSQKSDFKSLDDLYAKGVKNGKFELDDVIGFAEVHPELLSIYNDVDATIQRITELKQAALQAMVEAVKGVMMNSEESAGQSPFAQAIADAGVKTIQEYRDWLIETGQDFSAVDEYVSNSAEKIKEAAEKSEEAAETWLEAQARIAQINEEVNWAKSNNFSEQTGAIKGFIADDTVEGLAYARDYFNSLTTEMRTAIANEYPGLIKAMNDVDKMLKSTNRDTKDVTAAQRGLNAEIAKIERYNAAKHFEKTNEAIRKLENGTISVTDAYEEWTKDLNSVTKAYEDILKVQEKQRYNESEAVTEKGKNEKDITSSDVSNLAQLLDMTTDEVLADFPAAIDMFNELTGAAGELETMLNALNAAAFIKITGTSEADFSQLQDGLISTQNMAQETIDMLLATGQWTVESIKLNTEAWVQNADRSWSKQFLTGTQQILKPTGNNPLKRSSNVTQKDTSSSKRSGGGGGGGSKKDKEEKNNKSNDNPQTEVERMLNLMSQLHDIQEYQQSFYQSQSKYYEQTGFLQGVIAYNQKEIEVIQGQNAVLESNIATIESYIDAKKAELSTLSTTDDAYEDAADDLDRLQKAHQSYTKELVDNKSAVYQLTEAIKEQRKKIRNMEIDIRNIILEAIKDREQKNEDMLNAEIEMENKILDIIIKRYEKERDAIIESTNLRIDALREERDLLDEQLNLRKQQAQEEDKIQKLQDLELKYQRISADPTRQKEALSIRKEINELRDEMAWDTAEREVQAQQESIDQQITSLEDYIQYVEEYYEDLFEHPKKLIEEMRGILEMSQSEIIEWLKTNDEEYLNSSENTRTSIEKGWNDTLDEMYGIIKTYWDEVEEIISQGDEYIINFLKENSAKYQEAGKLQAEAYVEEWQEKLDNLKKAHQDVAAEIVAQYDVIEKASSSSKSSSDSSSSGGGGGGGGKKTTEETTKYGYMFDDNGKTVKSEKIYDTASEAVTAGETKKAAIVAGYRGANQYDKVGNVGSVTQYAKGGYVYSTGPAWLDGTRQNPEAVLNPYQTKLFESMVKAMESMSRIQVPMMPTYGEQTVSGSNVSVGDIIVNVDNLDTDTDYEELAQKVSDVLMERIGRTAVVGGLRINSY